MNLLHALILGTVEGLTEFLPISSTAHLTLTARLLGLDLDSDFVKSFVIAIQPGAILAVVVLYWRRLLIRPEILKRVAVAFLPTGILGITLYRYVKDMLGNNWLALAILALGGLFLLFFEAWYGRREREDGATAPAPMELGKLPYSRCLLIGCCQAVSFVPGVSRAAATIVGGMALGLDRKAAVEFSFLLAVPTMAAATAWDLWKNAESFSSQQFNVLLVGFAVAFVTAVAAMQFLVHYVRSHTFVAFGIYRILLAAVMTAVLLWLTETQNPV